MPEAIGVFSLFTSLCGNRSAGREEGLKRSEEKDRGDPDLRISGMNGFEGIITIEI